MASGDTPWFASWFDSAYYPILYSNRNKAEASAFIQLLAEQVLPKTGHLLDLACGRGRHAYKLATLGYQVDGIDLSAKSIEEARIEFALPNLHFSVQDMRAPLPLDTYDAVLNLFTSFGYFDDTADDILLLTHVRQSLKEKGMFVLDYLNPDAITDTHLGGNTLEMEGVTFKVNKQRTMEFVEKHIEVIDNGTTFNFRERVRLYKQQDFVRLFASASLQVVNCYGNYGLDPFTPQSPRQIWVCNKA